MFMLFLSIYHQESCQINKCRLTLECIGKSINSQTARLCGATVARLTPDQKVACSNHVRVKTVYFSSMSRKAIETLYQSVYVWLTSINHHFHLGDCVTDLWCNGTRSENCMTKSFPGQIQTKVLISGRIVQLSFYEFAFEERLCGSDSRSERCLFKLFLSIYHQECLVCRSRKAIEAIYQSGYVWLTSINHFCLGDCVTDLWCNGTRSENCMTKPFSGQFQTKVLISGRTVFL